MGWAMSSVGVSILLLPIDTSKGYNPLANPRLRENEMYFLSYVRVWTIV